MSKTYVIHTSRIPLTSFKESENMTALKYFNTHLFTLTPHTETHIYSAVACWNLTLKLSTFICRNFLILKSILNNQSLFDEGLCSHYITCKLKLWLPLAPWNVVAHISLYVSLLKVWVSVSEGQQLLFQVSVPVTLGQEVYGRALCHLLWRFPCKQTDNIQNNIQKLILDLLGRSIKFSNLNGVLANLSTYLPGPPVESHRCRRRAWFRVFFDH